jgi:hypothetical protein
MMAEDAFARFRRLRGLATQEWATAPVTKEAAALGRGVLVEDDKPSLEIGEADRPELMTPLAVLRTLHACGLRMTPYPGGRVRCRAPQDAWTPALLDALNRHQTAVADLLETFEERAAITEHYGGLSRADAERLAWETLLQKEMA